MLFTSDTDTETVVRLLNDYLDQGTSPEGDAGNGSSDVWKGAFTLAVIFSGENQLMMGARRGSPLFLVTVMVTGKSYLGSDAFGAPLTRQSAICKGRCCRARGANRLRF